MFTIYDTRDRLAYWRSFWAEIDRDVDEISSAEVYPLYPADRYIVPGQKILEAGVGMGRVMKHYRQRGCAVVGMDYEAACIRRLAEQDRSLQLYVGDVNHLPEPDATYDVVLAFGTLSNLPNPDRALAEMRRVLKRGGTLVASVTNDNLARRLLVGVRALGRRPRHFSMVAYTPAEWAARLTRAGFGVVAVAPVVTRLPLFYYFPFLRSRRAQRLDWNRARDGDRGLMLKPVGEWVFRQAFRRFPFAVSHGVVGVAKKPL